MTNLPKTAILLLDECRGIYIPQAFAEMEFIHPLEGIDDSDLDVLQAGPYPDNQDAPYGDCGDEYWDVWDAVLANAVVTGEDGTRYTLYQDGDLWAIPEDAEWPEDTVRQCERCGSTQVETRDSDGWCVDCGKETYIVNAEAETD